MDRIEPKGTEVHFLYESCDIFADPCSAREKKIPFVFHKNTVSVAQLHNSLSVLPFLSLLHNSWPCFFFFGWAGSVTEASPFLLDSYISLFPLLPLQCVQMEVNA